MPAHQYQLFLLKPARRPGLRSCAKRARAQTVESPWPSIPNLRGRNEFIPIKRGIDLFRFRAPHPSLWLGLRQQHLLRPGVVLVVLLVDRMREHWHPLRSLSLSLSAIAGLCVLSSIASLKQSERTRESTESSTETGEKHLRCHPCPYSPAVYSSGKRKGPCKASSDFSVPSPLSGIATIYPTSRLSTFRLLERLFGVRTALSST